MPSSFTTYPVLQFAFATLLPVMATATVSYLECHTDFGKMAWAKRQVIIGIVFGMVAVYGTEAGIPLNGATMNVRDAAPLAAGLLFGGPAGIIAGVIGGVERWFAALWGRGMFSRLACSVATLLAGLIGAGLRYYVFESKRPRWPTAFVVGGSVETFHLLLLFVTNLDKVVEAYSIALACNYPMIICNALSVTLSTLVYATISGEGLVAPSKIPDVTHKVRNGMLVVAFVGFMAIDVSLTLLIGNLEDSGVLMSVGTVEPRKLVLLAVTYMIIILLALLFVINYVIIRDVVVRGVWRVNDQLEQICYGDLNVEVNVRDCAEFNLLSDGINTTVGALRSAHEAEKARIEEDLATAKAIQESAMPRTFPPFPDIEAFDIYASMNAAREVGGDFYDFFMVSDRVLGLLIADVSGKGIPAALFMMEAKAELTHYMQSGMELSEAVRSANWNICRGNDRDMFVTVWAATLNYETGELIYVNAGHNPPLLRHNGEWRWLEQICGPVLGAFDIAMYRQQTLLLETGDELFLYTDGVNEAFNANDEEYGNDRLIQFVSSHSSISPHVLVDSLRYDIRRWSSGVEQSDDITMLCLEFGVPPTASWSLTMSATESGLEELLRRLDYHLEDIGCPPDTRGEVGIAVAAVINDASMRLQEDLATSDYIDFSCVHSESRRLMIASLSDRGRPLDPLVYGIPPSNEARNEIDNFGQPIILDGADDAVFIRDGERNVVLFQKRW